MIILLSAMKTFTVDHVDADQVVSSGLQGHIVDVLLFI